jgi:hypothetical protein
MGKEKTVELKPRLEKISEHDLKELQKVVNSVNAIQFNIGKIEVQKHAALHEFAIMQDKIKLLQDNLVKEYGSYDINVTDGTINWEKDEE